MPEKKKKTIVFHYIKNQGYRSVYADGVFGGITTHGNIFAQFFVERRPTPTTIEQELEPNGRPGKEVKREGKEGFIREIDVGVIMDLNTAKAFRDWLDKKIEAISKIK